MPDVVPLDAGRGIRYRTRETSAGAVVGAGAMLVACGWLWSSRGERSERSQSTEAIFASRSLLKRRASTASTWGTVCTSERPLDFGARFQHYRTPGPSQATNLRLNTVMLPLLGAGGAVTVCTVTEAQVDIDGARARLDLTRKASRLLLESAALTAARVAGEPVENL